MSRELHGSNVALTLLLGLNRKQVGGPRIAPAFRSLLTAQTYETMSPLEREMNLRTWWLVYTADRSGPCIEGSNPLLIEDMCDMVDLPAMM